MSRCGGPLNGLDDAVRLRGQSAERMRGRETCIFAKIGLWAGYQLQVPTTFSAEIPTGILPRGESGGESGGGIRHFQKYIC